MSRCRQQPQPSACTSPTCLCTSTAHHTASRTHLNGVTQTNALCRSRSSPRRRAREQEQRRSSSPPATGERAGESRALLLLLLLLGAIASQHRAIAPRMHKSLPRAHDDGTPPGSPAACRAERAQCASVRERTSRRRVAAPADALHELRRACSVARIRASRRSGRHDVVA